MANWSNLEIGFSGDEQRISNAISDIDDIIEGSNESLVPVRPKDMGEGNIHGYNEVEIVDYDTFPDQIYISGSGRSCGPHMWFGDMCEKHKLNGKYVDYDIGNDFFVSKAFVQGKIVTNLSTPLVSIEAIRELGLDRHIELFKRRAEADDWLTDLVNEIHQYADCGVSFEQLKEAWDCN